ncbi:hypothetical protein BDN72DRAFT_962279 [Pluteus cervinus]|uniref:Uncharacterized protein n=1 Tax=Pluteus cervinus TaxID=181527 RepID=A0ACD3AJ88_9AGAR|nr:hypothetical protein BDN72DRAFT_962279 [Pluteus cervinus]
MADPVFPPEIEHIIFTHALAQQGFVPFPTNLILVAKRVHLWLIPKLFETISVNHRHGGDYPIKWDPTRLERYGPFVRNLFLWASSQEMSVLCLSSCPHVTNLTFWVATKQDMMGAMSHLRLTHLSINFTLLAAPTPAIIETFSRVSHLDLLGRLDIEGPITHFTALTHLAISSYDITDELLRILFDRFSKLEVVVSLNVSTLYEGGVVVEGEFNPDVDDPRIVKMVCTFESGVEDWMEDVKYGRGMWGLADDAIVERRRERERRTEECPSS